MGENTQLLNKVLEIVEVMGEMRQQLVSFIDKCSDKDIDTAKHIEELQKRIGAIELEGSRIVRELLKEEANKVDANTKAICELQKSCQALKLDIQELKKDKQIINWKVGVIISFVSVAVTLFLTWLLNHFLSGFM